MCASLSDEERTKTQREYDVHLRRADLAKEEIKEDWKITPGTISIQFDLQKPYPYP